MTSNITKNGLFDFRRNGGVAENSSTVLPRLVRIFLPLEKNITLNLWAKDILRLLDPFQFLHSRGKKRILNTKAPQELQLLNTHE